MVEQAARSEQTSRIKLNPKVYVLILIAVLAYLPVLADLVVDWYQDSNYSHGFLIIPVSVWLIWRQRAVLSSVPIRSSSCR